MHAESDSININDKMISKLQSARFPEHKWQNLANGLVLGGEVDRINASSSTAKLNKVITMWTDREVSKEETQLWVILIKAVKDSEESRVAMKIAKEVGIEVDDDADEDD